MAGSGQERFSKVWGIACLVLSLVFVAGGITAFALGVPNHVYPITLQWAGSASAANGVVDHLAGAYRTGIYWDFALIVGYTGGILLACFLGRKVFWTKGLLRWALVGYFAVVVAALANVLQDVLLLVALRSSPFTGDWIFRITAAASFIKFTALLVAIPIGLVALWNAFSRLVTHRGFVERWKKAKEMFPDSDKDPWIIPPPPLESAGIKESASRTGVCSASSDWTPQLGATGGMRTTEALPRCTSPRTASHLAVHRGTRRSASRVVASDRLRSLLVRCNRCEPN